MQNRGAIRFVAIVLALICLYQLSFTLITNKVRNDAEKFANGDPKLERSYLDSIATEEVYPIFGFTYRECQKQELNLGLDLKGGMNVTLEVSVVDIIRSIANNSTDPAFLNAIQLAQEMQGSSDADFITLFGKAFNELNPNAQLAAIFSTLEMKERIKFGMDNAAVLEVIRSEAQDAIDNAFEILRSRIDGFGVAQPNIQQLETAGRIMVELPGVDDPDRVRNLLQGTASLEFWLTYENQEVFEHLAALNQRLKDVEAAKKILETPAADSTNVAEASQSNQGEFSDLLSEDSSTDSLSNDSTKLAEKEQLSAEEWQSNNPLWTVLRPAVDQQGRAQSGAFVGYAHFKDTAKVNSYLKQGVAENILPNELKLLWTKDPLDKTGSGNNIYRLVAVKINNRDGKPALSGEVITNARKEFSGNKAEAEVSVTMNGEGARDWARLTGQNIGKQIAIVLDDKVYSAPVVNQEISGGRSSITGNFTPDEADDLANILKCGKLPAPARIIQEEIVGPSLGHESINAGMFSFLLAFGMILIYMIFYYNKAGRVADLALVANIFFIFGVLASLGAVLTLPGLAGIVLTIGMSVDANVLIFERIREEIAMGKGVKLAIADGYKNAYSAIVDANITTFLTGIVLFSFGSGPIKGFATTLMIGIVTSLFAAIFITRLTFERSLSKKGEPSFDTKFTRGWFKNSAVNFIQKRKLAYVISGVIILIGLGSLITKGLDQGIDFKGGRTYIVRFDKDVKTSEIQSSLKDVYGEMPAVVTFGGQNQVKVTTKYKIDDKNPAIDEEVETKLYEGLTQYLPQGTSLEMFLSDYRMNSHKVGPTIADDIKKGAIISILVALVLIFAYIAARFRNWKFGLGALAALAHDALIVLGLFSIFYGILPFSMEIDQAFIAAILTVIGYSINDTVVIFDRIREFMNLHPKQDRGEVYNNALNSTLSRTFSTSLSTFVVLLTIFLFGGEVIRGFIFALLVGIVVGTYSSLFIATPVVYDTLGAIDKKKAKGTK